MLRKLLMIFLMLIFMTSCSGTNNDSNNNNSAAKNDEITDVSKNFLSQGVSINLGRSIVSLGDDAENYGKGYIQMIFGVNTEYYSLTEGSINDPYK